MLMVIKNEIKQEVSSSIETPAAAFIRLNKHKKAKKAIVLCPLSHPSGSFYKDETIIYCSATALNGVNGHVILRTKTKLQCDQKQ
jgi:hypothetical protein